MQLTTRHPARNRRSTVPVALRGLASPLLLTFLLIQPIVAMAGHWEPIEHTELAPHCPSSSSAYDYKYRCAKRSYITVPWSGAAFDPVNSRMIVWGGGHGDYWGNEVYVVNFAKHSAQRLTDPSPLKLRGDDCSEQLGDGRPRGRHTYGGLAYIAPADRLFAFGGSLACGPGNMSRGTWTFDLADKSWKRMHPSGPKPANVNALSVYSAKDKVVYLLDIYGLYAYSLARNHWTKLSDYRFMAARYGGLALDTKRDWLWLLGKGKVQTIDLAKQDYRPRTVTTTGAGDIAEAGYPGVLYDPKRDLIVAYSNGRHFKGDSRSVYFLNPRTHQWTVDTDRSIAAPKKEAWGVFGRWAYAPKLDAYVMYNLASEPGYVFYPDN